MKAIKKAILVRSIRLAMASASGDSSVFFLARSRTRGGYAPRFFCLSRYSIVLAAWIKWGGLLPAGFDGESRLTVV